MNESHRCPFDDALLNSSTKLEAGECGCRWRSGDVVLSPGGGLWLARWDRYARTVRWSELIPVGAEQAQAPGTLVCRDVDGERLPVVSLTDGDLLAVRSIA